MLIRGVTDSEIRAGVTAGPLCNDLHIFTNLSMIREVACFILFFFYSALKSETLIILTDQLERLMTVFLPLGLSRKSVHFQAQMNKLQFTSVAME